MLSRLIVLSTATYVLLFLATLAVAGLDDCATSSLRLRVLPGDPGASFLVAKLVGTHDCGSPMPLTGPPLSDEDLATIVGWIAAGAPRN